jgi:hypothetical protein
MRASSTAVFGWIRSPQFDGLLLFGCPFLALLAGVTLLYWPNAFQSVFLLNLWLLGYHHVIATFTRLTLDNESFQQHRFLVVVLPWLVLAGVLLAGQSFGWWILTSVYFYWQFFHYTRQSYGISRMYSRKSSVSFTRFDAGVHQALIYLFPLWGALHRSWQNPGEFLGMEFRAIPIPEWCVQGAAVASMSVLLLWCLRLLQQRLRGEPLPIAHTTFMLSHIFIFCVGYLWVPSLNAGWLLLNIWHNAQYLLIVWWANNTRFQQEQEASSSFLSRMCQHRFIGLYIGVCLVLTGLFYKTTGWIATTGLPWLFPTLAIPWVMVLFQSINIHHYIVDGIIWKSRKKTDRAVLQQSAGI